MVRMKANQTRAKSSYRSGERSARKSSRLGVLLCLVTATLSISMPAAADKWTQEELLATPRACLAQDLFSNNLHKQVVPLAEREQWARVLGESYKHYHHYCWGLIDMRRAASQPEKESFHLNRAIGNFDYVIRNSSQSFPMLPEVYLRLGMVFRIQGRHGDAASAFTGAIRAKSTYTPAFSALIDLYVDLEDLTGARNVLDWGLREAPNSKILLGKKAELETLTSDAGR